MTDTFTAGKIAFAVDLRIDVDKLANWSPERIAALFDGVAKVLAAHGEKVDNRKENSTWSLD